MSHTAYPYEQLHPRRFVFHSLGRKQIEKVVEFTPLGIENIVNLGFGDLCADGTIDDKANSNNGDILKVLSTVVEIIKHFTSRYPESIIHFTGSTEERNRLYRRILNTYYKSFSKEFAVFALRDEKSSQIVPFNPSTNDKYLRYLIKRII